MKTKALTPVHFEFSSKQDQEIHKRNKRSKERKERRVQGNQVKGKRVMDEVSITIILSGYNALNPTDESKGKRERERKNK